MEKIRTLSVEVRDDLIVDAALTGVHRGLRNGSRRAAAQITKPLEGG